MTPGHRRQRGLALIAAVLLAAVIAGLAVALTARDRYAILAVTRAQEVASVDALVQRLEVSAARVLAEDAASGDHDSEDEAWRTTDYAASDYGFVASARLEDAQRRFNLNALVATPPAEDPAGPTGEPAPATGDSPPSVAAGTAAAEAGEPAPAVGARPSAQRAMLDVARANGVIAPAARQPGARNEAGEETALRDEELAAARFALLLQALDLPAPILVAVLDWLDEDGETRFPDGAEDDYYSRLAPPYRAANGRFTDVSELRLVRGVTGEIYDRLAPFVTVLDTATPINVNTAPPEILMSLGPGIDRATAEQLASTRRVQAFTSIEALLRHPVLAGRALLPTGLSTSSRWFELTTRVERDAQPYFRRSLLVRKEPSRILTLRRAQLYTDG
jgi:type II secretory pathway component PulK